MIQKILKIVLISLVIPTAWVFAAGSGLVLGDGNIDPLPQLVSTTSPQSSITQRVFGKVLYLSGLNTSGATRCLQISSVGIVQVAAAACGSGSGGGGGGAGTFATTTSNVPGQLTNYPLNSTDIVVIGSTATTSAPFYFDPNTRTAVMNGLVTLGRIIATSSATSTFAGSVSIGSSTPSGNELFSVGSTTQTTFTYDKNSGYMGYGTSTPMAPFVLAQTGGLLTTDFIIDGVSAGSGAEMALNRANVSGTEANIDFNTAGVEEWQVGIQNNNTNNFEIWDGNDDPYFTINQATGDVGIGTSTPYSELTIWGEPGSNALEIVNTASSTQFVVNQNGLVGIGTSSPYAALSVVGASGVVAGKYFATSTASSTFVGGIDATRVCITGTTKCLNNISFPDGTVTSVGLSSANSSLSVGSTPVTTSGTITADFNLNHRNDWLALQTFVSASSTSFSSLDGLFVGRTATTSIVGENGTSTFSKFISFTSASSTATSTLAGINLPYGGCFAVAGVCVGGSSGSGSGTVNAGVIGQLAFYGASGTTVSGSSTDSLTMGRFIATSTRSSQLLYASSTSITASGALYGGNLNIGSGNLTVDSSGGLISLNNIAVSGTLTGGGLQITGGNLIFYTSSTVLAAPSDGILKLSNNAQTDFTRLQFGGTSASFMGLGVNNANGSISIVKADGTNNGYFGVGTSTMAVSQATFASTTGPQLSLSAGAGQPQMVMRNDGSNFTISSSTTGIGTSSPLFQVSDLATGVWSFGSTTPYAALTVQSAAGTGDLVVFATTTGKPVFIIDNNGHQFYSGNQPSCDSNCTFTFGNDNVFIVKLGTAITSSVVTFAKSWGGIWGPNCSVTDGGAVTTFVDASSTPTTVTLTPTVALTGTILTVVCTGMR